MSKNLGIVTAYGYAKAGGYTGTAEEFKSMLANAGRGIESIELTSTVGKVHTYTITYTDGTTQTYNVTDGEVTQAQLDDLKSDLNADLDTKADAIIETASGSIASFTDGGDDLPMKSLNVEIVPKQSGSGDPSPDNVRPISGWSGVEVYRTGVNVWDEEWENGTFNTTTGANMVKSTQIRTKNYIPVKPSTTYYFNANPNIWVLFFDGDKNPVPNGADSRYAKDGNSVSLGMDVSITRTFTSPSNAHYMRFYCQAPYGKTYNNDISINYPSTDTSYHPYQGESKSISFKDSQGNPITVYGGNMNITEGEGENKARRNELGSLNWDYLPVSSSFPYGAFYTAIYLKKYGEKNFVTDCYKMSNNDFSVDKAMLGNTGANTIYIMDSSFNGDVTAFKESLNGKYIVYERTDPTPIYCDPTEIRTLKGVNNIWADTGDVDVEYRADTTLAFEKLKNAIISLGGNI